jgi:hypothetical protein
MPLIFTRAECFFLFVGLNRVLVVEFILHKWHCCRVRQALLQRTAISVREISPSRPSCSSKQICACLPIPLLVNKADRQDVPWEEAHMAIYRLLHRGVFEPDDVRLLATVYEKVLSTVGVVDRKDPRAELIARKVVQLAQAGERDPECLSMTDRLLDWLDGRLSTINFA